MDLDVRMKAVCLAACFLIGKNLFIKNEEESYFHTEKCRKYHYHVIFFQTSCTLRKLTIVKEIVLEC